MITNTHIDVICFIENGITQKDDKSRGSSVIKRKASTKSLEEKSSKYESRHLCYLISSSKDMEQLIAEEKVQTGRVSIINLET